MKNIFPLLKFLEIVIKYSWNSFFDDVNQQIYDSLCFFSIVSRLTGIATMENTIFHIHKVKGQVNAYELET